MIAEVKEQNLVTIPAGVAAAHGIKPGSCLDWQSTDKADTLVVKVLPDFAALANKLMGAGRKHLKPGDNPTAALLHDRRIEDEERRDSLRSRTSLTRRRCWPISSRNLAQKT
jgi:bifunctional DNA-binding transcriptional regulator/antitoxin component of YhaV-PrlF toxin-antitoxin module